MEYDDNKLVCKKNNFKFNFWILQSAVLILSFIMGSVLILLILKYLKDITILNTFFILMYIYFFQLVVEVMKCFISYSKYKNLNENVSKLKDIFNHKFLIVNFCTFIFESIIILGCLLCSLFFSGFKILFILLMGISLGIIYLFYTIELLKLINHNLKKYNIEKFKNNFRDFLILCLINALFIILISNVFYLFKYLNVLVFVFIVIVNLLLFNINAVYLRKRF